MKFTCDLNVIVGKKQLNDLVLSVIRNLDFSPSKMYLSYNEFKKPKEDIRFDLDFIMADLSFEEMKGITAFSLYDEFYHSENVTPFFRFRISHLEEDVGRVKCSMEWIAYSSIDDGMLLEKERMSEILSKSSLIYCYYYEQSDVWEQSNMDINDNSWGRCLTIKGFDFMAAPLMYFGQECNDAIPFEKLSNYSKSEKIVIYNSEIIKIMLFDIHDMPSKLSNRKAQEDFWKEMNLVKLAKEYEDKNKIDFTAFLKNRAKKARSK